MRNSIFTIFLLVLLTSCASEVHVRIPTARMISPETKGKLLDGEFEAGNATYLEGTVSFDDAEVTNPIESEIIYRGITAAVELGVFEQLDFISRMNSASPSTYGVKAQILGDSRKNAKQGNHSLAITAMMGAYDYADAEEEGFDWTIDFTDEDDSEDIELTIDLEQTVYDFGLIYGYRVRDDSLMYCSVSMNQHNLDSDAIESDNETLDGKKISYSSKNYQLAIGLIRYFESSLVTRLEANATQIQWTRSTNETYGMASFSLGYYWD